MGKFSRRFSQGDAFCIAHLQEELFTIKQGELSVTSYFTEMKIICDELDNFCPDATCVCTIPCACHAQLIIKKCHDNDYVISFLKGLNDKFSTVCLQILLLDPQPMQFNDLCGFSLSQEHYHSLLALLPSRPTPPPSYTTSLISSHNINSSDSHNPNSSGKIFTVWILDSGATDTIATCLSLHLSIYHIS